MPAPAISNLRRAGIAGASGVNTAGLLSIRDSFYDQTGDEYHFVLPHPIDSLPTFP